MKGPVAPTLSAHLLQESRRFLLYPQRMYRTKTNLRAQEILDNARRKLIEWRKTFAPSAERAAQLEGLWEPVLLDEVYCRDLLESAPGLVERTTALSAISLMGVARPDPLTIP